MLLIQILILDWISKRYKIFVLGRRLLTKKIFNGTEKITGCCDKTTIGKVRGSGS